MGAAAGGVGGLIGLLFGIPYAIAFSAGGIYLGGSMGSQLDKDAEGDEGIKV